MGLAVNKSNRNALELAMDIYLNGKIMSVSPGTALSGLITDLGLDSKTVIAELNSEIVPSIRFETTELNPGDRLELLHFVGGG